MSRGPQRFSSLFRGTTPEPKGGGVRLAHILIHPKNAGQWNLTSRAVITADLQRRDGGKRGPKSSRSDGKLKGCKEEAGKVKEKNKRSTKKEMEERSRGRERQVWCWWDVLTDLCWTEEVLSTLINEALYSACTVALTWGRLESLIKSVTRADRLLFQPQSRKAKQSKASKLGFIFRAAHRQFWRQMQKPRGSLTKSSFVYCS